MSASGRSVGLTISVTGPLSGIIVTLRHQRRILIGGHARGGSKRIADQLIDLDVHRGLASQKATDLRRLVAEVQADERALRSRQEELESHLLAAAATDWLAAAEKARYLLSLFAATPAAQDPRRQKLILNVLEDFRRLGLMD
jgi:hypothetical protein